MPRKDDAHMDELEGVAQRLRDERPQASPLDLDRIKTTAMARAKSGAKGGRAGARRLAVAGLTVGLLVATTGGVLAGESHGKDKGGNGGGNAANAQYGGECDPPQPARSGSPQHRSSSPRAAARPFLAVPDCFGTGDSDDWREE